MISKRNAKYVFIWACFSLPFFALLYLEDRLYILGLSLSNIWKLIALSFAGLAYAYRFMIRPSMWQLSIVLVCLTYPVGLATGFTKITIDILPVFLALPFFFAFFYLNIFAKSNSLEVFLIGLCAFFILSGIPFAAGVLEEPSNVVESSAAYTERFGVSHNALIGFFKHPSIAGKVFALSSGFLAFLVVTRTWRAQTIRLAVAVVALIGFYFTYLSFVRTAWLMLVTILVFGVAGLSHRLEKRQIFLVLCLILLLVLLAVTQPGFIARLLNLKVSSASDSSIIAYSSGRALIWIEIFFAMLAEGPASYLIGLGAKGYDEAMGYVYAHSMIVQVFAFSGVVGLTLLAVFFWSYHSWLQQLTFDRYEQRFLRSLILAFLIAALLSHGIEFYGAVLLGGISAMFSRRKNELLRSERDADPCIRVL